MRDWDWTFLAIQFIIKLSGHTVKQHLLLYQGSSPCLIHIINLLIKYPCAGILSSQVLLHLRSSSCSHNITTSLLSAIFSHWVLTVSYCQYPIHCSIKTKLVWASIHVLWWVKSQGYPSLASTSEHVFNTLEEVMSSPRVHLTQCFLEASTYWLESRSVQVWLKFKPSTVHWNYKRDTEQLFFFFWWVKFLRALCNHHH